MLAGDSRAIARAITLIEDESPAGAEIVRRVFAKTGRAYLIGVTGPPGAGKSTLVDQADGRDPRRPGGRSASSPWIRRARLRAGRFSATGFACRPTPATPGVFIRSMATRGHLGGLAQATSEVALVLDAAGKDVVLIETVGVGQDEVDIVRTADISVVMVVPGSGDEVQALKAGIMEIADIFVVNKADREGADRTVASIETVLVAADVRAGRVAAADPEDRGHERQGRAGAARRRSTGSARSRPSRRAPAGEPARNGGSASSSRSGSCSTSSAACLKPASSSRCSTGSPREKSIRILPSTISSAGQWQNLVNLVNPLNPP